MAISDNGRLNIGIGLDNNNLRSDAAESQNILRSIAMAAEDMGVRLDGALNIKGETTTSLMERIVQSATEANDILTDIGKIDLGRQLDLETAEDKITRLLLVIRGNEDALTSLSLTLQKYEADAKAAFAAGDMGTFKAISADIEETIRDIQEVQSETENYRATLEMLKTATGQESTEPVSAPQLFTSQEDYEYAQRLKESIAALQEQIAKFDGSKAELQGLRTSLMNAQTQLNGVENKAAAAASRLGADLGGRAAEASTRLYQLNDAVKTQQEVVEALQSAVNEAAEALNALSGSEDTGAIDEAQVRYQALSQELQNATNGLYNLQAAQQNAQSTWANVSGEIERHDSILVKLLGGQDKYNQIIGQMPAPLQAAASGITGMTGAAKAFIATPLGAILAAIILAVQALTTWFNSSAEGQMAFAKVSGYVSGVLGQLKEIVIAVGKAIYNAFKDPQKAIKDLWNVIKENVVNRFKAVGEIAGSLGKIIKAAFTLDTDGIKAGIKELTNGFLKFGTGVDNVTGKMAQWAEGVNNAASATADIAVEEKKLDVEVSKWQKRKAELDKAKAEASAKMYDTSLSKAERKKALEQYKAALKEQQDTELRFADQRVAIQQKRMDLTTNSLEDEAKLNDLQAERVRIEAQGAQELASLQRRSNSINRGNTGGTTTDNSAKEAERQRQAELQAEKQRASELTSLQRQNRQAEIDEMEDASERKIAQIKFDYDKQMSVIREQEKKWKDAQNGSLTEGQQKAIDDAVTHATKQRDNDLEKANKEQLERMLADVLTYEERREKLQQEYAKKREAMYDHDKDGKRTGLKIGVNEGNVAELDRQEQETLKAVDEQFAAREAEYQAWCNAIGDLTLKQLQDLLAKAKAELKALEQNGGDSKQLATARAKVNKLSETVKKQQATDQLAPKKRTIKEWQDLYSTLNECAGAFDDIGDAVGGTAGEILKAAGQISTSALQMINGIVTLANSSGKAMAGTAAAASTAIQTVEKASVILAVISAALQIATAIANLFNDDDKKQEEIERLQDRIDQLQWELDNADTLRLNSHYGSSLDRVNAAISETRKELIANAQVTGDWYQLMIACYGKLSNNAAVLSKTTKALASEYEKMSYTADKALGDDRYNNYYEQLQNISEQQVLIREQIANEKSKKKSDSGKIAEWEQKIEELGQQAANVINDMLEDIIGGSATQISDDLSEAFFDAFANGEDAAEAWGDKVKEITADIVKRMLVQKLLEPEIGKIFDKYKAQWFKDGEFIGAEGVKNSMNSFMNDLLNLNGVMNEIWEAIPDDLRAFLTGDTDREGVSKGIAAASQDSVDELNARATTIQSHTFSISENTKLLVANTVSILASVLAIERHTEAISTRMEVVERDLHQVRNTIDDFSTQGVKLK